MEATENNFRIHGVSMAFDCVSAVYRLVLGRHAEKSLLTEIFCSNKYTHCCAVNYYVNQ